MEGRNDASTNITGNAVTGEANQPESNASTAKLDDDTSQLEVDFSGLNLDNEFNQPESTESNVNIDRETGGDLDLERTGAETIDLQDDVSTPGAGEDTTQLSSTPTVSVGTQTDLESQNKRRDEYIQSYAEKLVQDSNNVNLFILCQEVLTNKRHKKIHEIVRGASLSPVQPENPTFTIVLWNVNGPTIPNVPRDTEKKRNGNVDAYVYRVFDDNNDNDNDKDKHLTTEDLKRIANIQTMLPDMKPFDVGFKCEEDTTWESLPKEEIDKWFNRMGVVLYNDILIVSWHGPYYKLSNARKLSNVDLMKRVVESIRSNKDCKTVIIGGDFNIDVESIKDKFPDHDIIIPAEKTRNDNTLDFLVTWPKNAFVSEESPKVDEGPHFIPPVFDHKIVKYTLKVTREQNQSASSC